MKRLLLIAVLLAFAVAGSAQNVALLHSDFRPGDRVLMDSHVVRDLGWDLDRWCVDELPEMFKVLDKYDFLVVSPCWNFTPGKASGNE